MPSKIKRLYRAIIDLLLVPYTVSNINITTTKILTLLGNTILSPIDRHIFLSSIYGGSDLNDLFFEGWNIKRIDKSSFAPLNG